MKMEKQMVEYFHISTKSWGGPKSIDLFIDHEKKEVRIKDSYYSKNRIRISACDWNNLIGLVREKKIGKVRD